MDTDDVNRILVEIATGRPAPFDEAPEFAAMRAQLQKECDEIVAKGGTIDVPHEIP